MSEHNAPTDEELDEVARDLPSAEEIDVLFAKIAYVLPLTGRCPHGNLIAQGEDGPCGCRVIAAREATL